MPENKFFQHLAEATEETEPPRNYIAWSAIAVLSALLGKKCFIPQGHFTTFPNLYIVLVGEPALRKTTAMEIGKKLIRKIPEVPLAPESSSREALIDSMAKSQVKALYNGKDVSYWQNAAFLTELKEFIGGKHINQNMIGFLTAIWDEPFFKESTRKSGEVIIQNPYFSMLACCTQDWLTMNLKADVISDGFTRRTIFHLEKEKYKLIPWPEDTKQILEARDRTLISAKEVFKLTGPFVLTREARELWDTYYSLIQEQAEGVSDKVRHYYSSKHILLQKVSMCLSAGYRLDRVVDSECLQAAMTFLDTSEVFLDEIFSGIGRNPLKAYADKILQFISENPAGRSDQEIRAKFYDELNLPEIKEICEQLVSSQQITSQVQSTAAGFRYSVEQAKPRKEQANLLQLACRLTSTREVAEESSGSANLEHLLDPATEQLLARQRQAELDSAQGLLRRGKPRQQTP